MKCTFCGKDVERGCGKIFVQTTGKILYFCSMKCEKNMLKLGRKARNLKWTADYSVTKAANFAAIKAQKEKKAK
jgi:large subunit ribosomal protein L24e